jgi:hypothetical protein
MKSCLWATKAPKLSSVQENLLRQAQSYAKETGQNPAEVKRLTGMYGDLNAAKEAEMSAADRKKTVHNAIWSSRRKTCCC